MGVLERIFLDFPREGYVLDIQVLDGAGNAFPVFRGAVEELREQHFAKCFRNAGCFYAVTCLGVDKNLLNSLDLHFSSIERIEFVWLTQPKAPYLLASGERDATVAWEECLYCGFSGKYVDPDAIQYIVEVAEGHTAKGVGVAARNASDADLDDEYVRVCARFERGEIQITDLKSATWYHIRNVVQLHGVRHMSKPVTFKTPSNIPEAPECARVYEIPNKSAENPSEERAPAVVLQWSAPDSNGAEIETYQVQFQETVLEDEEGFQPDSYKIGSPLYVNKVKTVPVEPERDEDGDRRKWGWGGGGGWVENKTKINEVKTAMVKTRSKKKREVTIGGEEGPSRPVTAYASIEDSGGGWNVVTGKWTSVYSNLERKLKLSAPSSTSLEWKFRIRAKNQHGWSPFSPVLYMHRKSHPSLFRLWFPPTVQVDAADTKPSPNPLLSPDKNLDAEGLAVARREYAKNPIQSSRPPGMPLLASSGYNNMMLYQRQQQSGGYGVPGMMYGMDTMLMMGGPRGAPPTHLQDPSGDVNDDILESMPLSAGDSGVLMSRQRPSSADSAESASMLDRRASRESNRNRSSDYSPGSTPADGTRRKSAPPKQSAASSLFME